MTPSPMLAAKRLDEAPALPGIRYFGSKTWGSGKSREELHQDVYTICFFELM